MLLDNFNRAVSMEKRKALEQDEQTQMKKMGVSRADAGNPLNPLLEALSMYKSEASIIPSQHQKRKQRILISGIHFLFLLGAY